MQWLTRIMVDDNDDVGEDEDDGFHFHFSFGEVSPWS